MSKKTVPALRLMGNLHKYAIRIYTMRFVQVEFARAVRRIMRVHVPSQKMMLLLEQATRRFPRLLPNDYDFTPYTHILH